MWCGREGLLQYSSKSQITSPSFCVFFWGFGHPPAGILSEVAPVAGQARVGLFWDFCPVQLVLLKGAACAEFLEPQLRVDV